MFHSFTMTVGLLLPMTRGLSIVAIKSLNPPKNIITEIIQHRATVMPAIPQLYRAFVNVKLPSDLPLRVCFSGAAPLPVEVLNAFNKNVGIPLLEGYGLSETSPVACMNPLNGERKPGSVGLPIGDVQFQIRNDDGFVLPVRTIPGGLNFYRSGTRERIEPLNIGSNNPLGLQMEEQRRKAIRENFFVDQLMTVQGQNMTATEVMQRTEEKMRLLGPVLGRLQSELLQPLVTRAFNLLFKNNKFAPPPETIGEQEIEIEYVSPLAKAQKTQELSSVMRGIEIFGSLQNVAPVFDYLDVDGLVDHIKDVLGLPAKVMRSRAEVQKIQQEKQAAEMEQAQLQQAQQVAESAGKIAPALKAGMLNE